MCNLKQKKFIITGGAGFIGSNLVRKLLNQKAKVIVIDDLSSGFEKNLPNNPDLNIIKKQVQKVKLDKFCEIDGLFHLAAQASVPLSIKKFSSSSNNNLLSSLNVLDFCSKYKIPLVYASSSAVYGNMSYGNDMNKSVQIVHPYAADKFMLEEYAKMCNLAFNLSSCGLRFFNVYGPYQDPKNPYSGVISIFANRLLNKMPLEINGGFQKRDFIFIKDVVDAIIASYAYIKNKKVSKVFNVMSSISTSIDELADIMSKYMNVDLKKIYKPLMKNDPIKSSGNSNKIFKELNFKPETNLKDGLKITIDWIKNEE